MGSGSGETIMRSLRLLIGIMIWIAFLYCLWVIGEFAYARIFPTLPPESTTLAAFFDSPDSMLSIKGEVHKEGMPVSGGKAEILVEKLGGEFKQSALVDIVDGIFILQNDPRFAEIKPSDRLFIDVQINSKELTNILSRYIYVNEPPKLSRHLIRPLGSFSVLLIFVFLLWFLWVFTGPKSDLKARWAFKLAYCMIFMSLVTPLIAPAVLTYVFPNMQRVMAESPVGIIMTEINDGEEIKPQWALNIGGSTKFIDDKNTVMVEGGLVIPLYIIILAILGGAINMTRQVPAIQRKKVRQQELGMADGIVYHPDQLLQLMKGFFGKGRPTVRENGDAVPEKNDSKRAIIHQVKDKGIEDPTDWRENLINQYMYLLSAPFLGIVTFYLLNWMDFTKKPVIVLVSFSIGLISEYILLRITETAKGILPESLRKKNQSQQNNS